MRRATVRAKAPTTTAPKKRVKGTVVAPEYILRLMEEVGPTKAAALIGTLPGTLHKARKANAVTKSFEVAARGVWHEQGFAAAGETAPAGPRTTDLTSAAPTPDPASDGVALLLIQVPRERAPMLQRAAEHLGALILSHD